MIELVNNEAKQATRYYTTSIKIKSNVKIKELNSNSIYRYS